ncbi:PAS domain S-box [Synechococcus sp. PCC 7502]|uniref:CHASE2 domain-containing protein n=1 Tax=Synechococcus sp. PCC 7502 TaxID=1173263 RepID=UPI00029FEECA|nr:CHASE2 domain-containing protein [Synechococcus sp. PCC 7502]AFY74531.1 PAS domain S-box [Synechococcus sp. PCC 7502]
MRAKIRNQIWAWRGVLVVTPITVLLVIALRALGFLQLSELFAYDQLLQLRPSEPQDQRVIIVGIDEIDLQTLEKYPISDRILAELITKIRQQKPRAIGLDIVRDLPVEPGHDELVKVFKTTPNLVGVRTIKSGTGAIAPPPTLQDQGQVSAAELIIDNDGVVRRGFWGAELEKGQSILGLGLYTALEFLNAEPNVRYPQAVQSPHYFKSNDGGYVGAEDLGDQVLLNYRRSEPRFRTVSLRDVLQNKIPQDLFSDRLVLIGVTAVSLKDFFSTPLDRNFGTSFSQTAGVEIHAQVASQVLAAAIDGREGITTWEKPWEYLWIIVWTVGIGIFTWQLRNFRTAQQFWLANLSGVILTVGAIALSDYGAFIVLSWWIPLIPPIIGVVSTGLGMTAFIYVDRLKASEQRYRLIADELRIAEANYRSIFENAVEGIFQMTPKGKFLSVNPSFAEMFGYESPQDLITHLEQTGESLYVSPNCLTELNLLFSETNSDEVSGFEYQAYRRDRSIIWIRESVRIVRDADQNILYYEGIADDYTKAKLAETSLKQQLEDLKIEIDEVKRQKQVSQITESDFFRDIQAELATFSDDDDDFEL